MAILYPWATKEYLLWSMSLSQIIYYFNVGMELKYPKATNGKAKPGLSYNTQDVIQERAELKRLYGDVE